jgi:hypothetical protein
MSPLGVSVSWDAGTHYERIISREAGLRNADGWQCLIMLEKRAPGRCVGIFPSIGIRISKWLP